MRNEQIEALRTITAFLEPQRETLSEDQVKALDALIGLTQEAEKKRETRNKQALQWMRTYRQTEAGKESNRKNSRKQWERIKEANRQKKTPQE